MTTGQLLWAGLASCIVSLAVQLFPAAADALGVDLGAAWRLFGFGLFLIAIASFMAAIGGRTGR
ncbi:MAG TPA: hypothetical protein PKM48_04170 [Parvularculaceae bacterium]|nr:hypothetical protein [Parvularculaceae bacterium]HNS87063.1 hypothetical protein [Parvularculaceae bacterium]